MKPVLILQHLGADGPAYLASWLRQQGVAFDLRNTQAGEDFPTHLRGHSALAILGGEMSANEALPSLRRAQELVRQALQQGLPTLGHCLGGQLIARALGAAVRPAQEPEIGWCEMHVDGGPRAREWFGTAASHQVFQWHYESFELPAGATPLGHSPRCPHQAFEFGPLLALQFHLELDAEKLGRWARDDDARHQQVLGRHLGVMSGAQMLEGAGPRLQAQQALADRIYSRWWCQAAGRRAVHDQCSLAHRVAGSGPGQFPHGTQHSI